MSFTLHEVSKNAEFGQIMPVANESYSTPFNGFWEILKGPLLDGVFPVDLVSNRYALWHRYDPTSRWIYAKDTETQKVVGAMQWNIHEKNPFEQPGSALDAYWWPEGDMKFMSNKTFENFYATRRSVMSKPHFLIGYCFVLPKYRHRGVGSMMMKWGLQQADAKGLDIFVESTEDGRGLYEAFGFESIDSVLLDAEIPGASDGYNRLKDQYLPMPYHMMLRSAPITVGNST